MLQRVPDPFGLTREQCLIQTDAIRFKCDAIVFYTDFGFSSVMKHAEEFAKFTEALSTPTCALSILSTLIAHDAQLKPVTGKFFFTEVSMSLFF